MHSPKNSRGRPRAFCFAVGFLFLSLLSGCGIAHIRAIREAQDSFSRAAEHENQVRLENYQALSQPLPAVTEASTGYRVAVRTLDEVIKRKKGALQRDNLLCTAYVIQALSLWRLGDHTEALGVRTAATAGNGCAPAGAAIPPREAALLAALPGLIRIDQANAIALNDNTGEFEQVQQLVTHAQADLTNARNQTSPKHPVRVYLLMSELAGIKVWLTAIDTEGLQGTQQEQADTRVRAQAREKFNAYCRLLTDLGFDKNSDPSILFWGQQFGITCADEQPSPSAPFGTS